jgi:hypothetical protein
MILPASPTKCPLPMLLANNDAPTYNANYLIIIFWRKKEIYVLPAKMSSIDLLGNNPLKKKD